MVTSVSDEVTVQPCWAIASRVRSNGSPLAKLSAMSQILGLVATTWQFARVPPVPVMPPVPVVESHQPVIPTSAASSTNFFISLISIDDLFWF